MQARLQKRNEQTVAAELDATKQRLAQLEDSIARMATQLDGPTTTASTTNDKVDAGEQLARLCAKFAASAVRRCERGVVAHAALTPPR